MSQYEVTDNSMSNEAIRKMARTSMDRSQKKRERREERRANRSQVRAGRFAVLAATAGLAVTHGGDAANFAANVGSKIGDTAAKIGRVLPDADQASKDAAANHAPIPATEAGLEREANANIDANHRSQAAAEHRNQQP